MNKKEKELEIYKVKEKEEIDIFIRKIIDKLTWKNQLYT